MKRKQKTENSKSFNEGESMKLNAWFNLMFKIGLVVVISVIIVILNVHNEKIRYLERDLFHLEDLEDRFQEAYDGRVSI